MMNARGAQKRRGKGLELLRETDELSNWEERGDGRRRLSMMVYEKPIGMPQRMEIKPVGDGRLGLMMKRG
jgi:hypothetical protein